jgi:hypothetical protein
MPLANPELYMARLRRLAAEQGGIVLSAKYINDSTKLKFRCAEGHEFSASPGHVKSGKWCRLCGFVRAGRIKRDRTLAQLQALMFKRGGQIDASTFVRSGARMEFRCAHGHAWRTTPSAIMQGGWCPKCVKAAMAEKFSTPTRQQMLALIASRGAELLEPGYRNYHDTIRVRCRLGHEFERVAASIFKGLWCPGCAGDFELLRLREAAVAHGGELISTEYLGGKRRYECRCAVGHRFSLAGTSIIRGTWCRRCRSPLQRTLEDLQRLARLHDGECIETVVPEPGEKVGWRCHQGHEWRTMPDKVAQGHWCRQCSYQIPVDRRRQTLAHMQQTAMEYSGRCLSKRYFGAMTKLRWECARGHRWSAIPANVRRGTWCPKCSQTVRGTLDGIQAMAVSRGGKCRTKRWDNHKVPLDFTCAKGHEFRLLPAQVRTGVWCPKCKQPSRGKAKTGTRKNPSRVRSLISA